MSLYSSTHVIETNTSEHDKHKYFTKKIMLNSNMTESIFSTIFGRGGFQRNLFSFENKSNLKILLHQILLKIIIL